MEPLISALLIFIAVVDLKTFTIHNISLLALSLLFLLDGDFSLLRFLVSLPVLALLTISTSIGGGDIKLLAILIAFRWHEISSLRYLWSAWAISAILVLQARWRKEPKIAFGPALSIPLVIVNLEF